MVQNRPKLEFIKENTSTIKDMERESLYGLMDNFMKGNGKQVKKMDMEYGNLPKETTIKNNG